MLNANNSFQCSVGHFLPVKRCCGKGKSKKYIYLDCFYKSLSLKNFAKDLDFFILH